MRLISYEGKSNSIIGWARLLNISYDALRFRLKRGYSFGEAIKKSAPAYINNDIRESIRKREWRLRKAKEDPVHYTPYGQKRYKYLSLAAKRHRVRLKMGWEKRNPGKRRAECARSYQYRKLKLAAGKGSINYFLGGRRVPKI